MRLFGKVADCACDETSNLSDIDCAVLKDEVDNNGHIELVE